MADNMVKFRYGTYANFINIEKDDNTLYFITDEGNARLYKGDKLFTQQWQIVSGLPSIADAHTDRLYIDTNNNKLSYFDGWSYKDVLEGGKIEIASSVTATGENVVSSKAIYDFVHAEIAALAGSSTDSLVSEIVAGEDSGTLIITKGETDTNVILKGVVIDPSWDSTQRILTLPNTTTGKEITINFGKDMVVTSGSYDASAKELVLVVGDAADNNVIRVPVGDLVNTYTASTDVSGAVQIAIENNQIKGSILVDSGSVLKIVDGKLTIDLINYITATTFNELKNRVDALEVDVKNNDTRIVALNNFIDTTLDTRIDNRISLKDYDTKIAGLNQSISDVRGEFAAKDADMLVAAKEYADAQVSNVKTLWDVIS